MLEWHRWVGRAGEQRDLGRAVTGACNLAFLFLILSGIFLWWPRNWSSRVVRSAVWLRRGLPGKARDSNWHNVIGLWAWVPLVVIVASGVVISYDWAGDLVYKLAGEEPTGRGERGTSGRASEPREASADAPAVPGEPRSLDDLIAVAAADNPGWQSLTVDLATRPRGPVGVSVDRSAGGQPAERLEVEIDRGTGRIVSRKGYASLGPGRRLRSWLRFAHSGEVYGFVGQTVAGLASAGAVVLVWTGLALSWRRFFGQGRA
jgi:uncharacterized iron-regulated membrane protein